MVYVKIIQGAVDIIDTCKTYLTQGYAVGELTEYHAHKVAPCVKALGLFVRGMLFNQRFD